MLEAYASRFSAAEVNSTYYRLPAAKTVEGWVEKTAGSVTFAVKLPKELTHTGSPIAGSADAGWKPGADAERAAKAALECVAPLEGAGAMGALLAQFPSSFHRTRENSRYLGWLRRAMGNRPLVFEFRNAEWIRPEVLKWLSETGTGFACADQPRLSGLMPPFFLATSDTGYVRMHGRNAANWWTGDNVTRYEYDYSGAEMAKWAKVMERAEESPAAIPLDENAEVFLKERGVLDLEKLPGFGTEEKREILKKIFFFYNNHSHAYAAKNALKFREMLMRGAPDAPEG